MDIVDVTLYTENDQFIARCEKLGLETRGMDADEALKKMRSEADRLMKDDPTRPTYEFLIKVK